MSKFCWHRPDKMWTAQCGECHDDRGSKSSALCPHLIDDEGFTTIAMVIAIVLTLSLLFSAAQVYRLETETAAIQEVADVTALAAENIVAEFMIVVRVCDAVVLSLSLLALTVFGISVVLLCIPPTQPIGSSLIDLGAKVMQARDKFAQSATDNLNKLARALPYLAAASAASVGAANSSGQHHAYIAAAVLVPTHVDEITIADDGETDAVLDDINGSKDALASSAAKAEEAAKEAQEAKMAGYLADCGRDPDRCMKERAATLAGLSGAANPTYSSVDTWSFSVALKRAQDYFRARAALETPASDSVKEQSNSYLRSLYYAYVNDILAQGYVREGTGVPFECNFPLPPRNTDEMRTTRLYTDATFPITQDGDTMMMHAWPGCPKAAGSSGRGSLAQMEAGGYTECPVCHFKAQDLGKIGAASTSINTGFEYHYVEVAKAASEYQSLRATVDASGAETKAISGSLFDSVKTAIAALAGKRIEITPPGAYGAIAMVADVATFEANAGFGNSIVASAGTVGPRAAVSGATLIEEPAGEGGTVISSLLDGLSADGGSVVGAARIVLDAWSGMLEVYAHGAESLGSAIDSVLGAIPLISAAGLGTWASNALSDTMADVGLAPADLDALKPVLVNSGRVAAADDGAFASRFLVIKNGALALTDTDGSVFGDLIDEVSAKASAMIGEAGEIEIACIELPVGGARIPIVITLPPGIISAGQGLVESAASGLKGLIGSIVRGPIWQ